MIHRLLAPLLCAAALAAVQPALTSAGCRPYQEHYPKLLLHLVPATAKNPCAALTELPECNVRLGGFINQEYIVYVLAAGVGREAGIASVSFSLERTLEGHIGYPSAFEILGWGSCADNYLLAAGWPNVGSQDPYSGPTGTFWWNIAENCQRTPLPDNEDEAQAVVAWFRLRSPIEEGLGIRGEIFDCLGGHPSLDYWEDLARAYFSPGGQASYVNPCNCGYFSCGGVTGPARGVVGDTLVYTGSLGSWICASPSWQITGNARIVRISWGTEARVVADEPGTFELVQRVDCNFPLYDQCGGMSVTVEPKVPVLPITWGRIKTLLD